MSKMRATHHESQGFKTDITPDLFPQLYMNA